MKPHPNLNAGVHHDAGRPGTGTQFAPEESLATRSASLESGHPALLSVRAIALLAILAVIAFLIVAG